MSETARLWEEKEKKKAGGMKEAQERFKAENPDFKGVVIKRVAAPKFDEVPRTVRRQRGLSAAELFAILSEIGRKVSETAPEKAPTLAVHNLPGRGCGKAGGPGSRIRPGHDGRTARIGWT